MPIQPVAAAAARPAERTPLQFTEDMHGTLRGPGGPVATAFRLTIDTDDLDAFLRSPDHAMRARGTVSIAGHPMEVVSGTFNLFRLNAQGVREMLYDLTFRAPDGQLYRLQGTKTIRNDQGFDMWRDTTTLATTITRVSDGAVVLRGDLRLNMLDLARQMTTFRSTNAGAVLQFLRFFSGNLVDTYVR